MLEINGLEVSYECSGRAAVQDISFNVDSGEVVALIGESGSGKSTIAHAVVQMLPVSARITAGAIRVDGDEVSQLSAERLRELRAKRIALVPQHGRESLSPSRRVRDLLEDVAHHTVKLARPAARAAAARALEDVRLHGRVARHYPHQLSGGMQQRVLIALALIRSPDLLLLDEPTTGLDATVQREILDLLRELHATRGMSMLLISHDLGVVRYMADRLVVLHEGRVVEQGRAGEVLAAPAEEYTQHLVRASAALGYIVEGARANVAPGVPPVLSVEGLSRSFGKGDSKVAAVDGLSFDVLPGQILALIGESGSGKSTVARCVTGLDRAYQGRISLDGRRLAPANADRELEQRRTIQLIFQDPRGSLNPRRSVEQILVDAARHLVPGADPRGRTAETLELVRLSSGLLDRRPHQLSGGEAQRVAIARALVGSPRVLVCDEPVSALDVSIQASILELLLRLSTHAGLSLLFISHDLGVVRGLADEVVILRNGVVQERGRCRDILAQPGSDYGRRLVESALR